MLEQIRNKINRLKEAKAWLQTHLYADEMTFSKLFSDVLDLINEKAQEQIKSPQLVKEGQSSFVRFN